MFTTALHVITYIFNDSFVIGLVIVSALYILQRRFGFYVLRTEDSRTTADSNTFSVSSTYCNAENCVRCHKYGLILERAREKVDSLEDGEVKQRIKPSLNNEIPKETESLNEPNPNVFLCNALEAKSFWNSCQLTLQYQQDLERMEESWEQILGEFKRIYIERHLHHWKRNSSNAGSWDVFHLVNQGVIVKENLRLCPKTATIIEKLTTAMKSNVFGNILFSVVKPSTVISPHYGPTNIRLRCHLGLITNSECILNVGTDQATWECKRCLIFDDSFLHSVEHFGNIQGSYEGNIELELDERLKGNSGRSRLSPSLVDDILHLNTDEVDQTSSVKETLLGKGDRAVLIVDLWHPELCQKERNMLDYLFAPEEIRELKN